MDTLLLNVPATEAPTPATTSADETVARFGTARAAAKYSKALSGSATHRRELRCILAGLSGLPQGAAVLDLPCGTGRLLPALASWGYTVTSADSSPHMVNLAMGYADQSGLTIPADRFVVADALHQPFEDDRFDAVICNRLLHHLREAEVRRSVLREMRRVCRGTIVASFFCRASFDGLLFCFRNALRRLKATDRIPIARKTFQLDAREAGLTVKAWLPTRPWISMQWYAVMERS